MGYDVMMSAYVAPDKEVSYGRPKFRLEFPTSILKYEYLQLTFRIRRKQHPTEYEVYTQLSSQEQVLVTCLHIRAHIAPRSNKDTDKLGLAVSAS